MSVKRETKQKAAVRGQLEAALGFISAQDLYLQLVSAGQKVGLTTVYRALTDLVESGEADFLASAEGETRYRACGSDHHHHLICRSCGVAVEFEMPGFEAATKQLAENEGFVDVSHSIEIFGICAKCADLPQNS